MINNIENSSLTIAIRACENSDILNRIKLYMIIKQTK